MKYSKGCKIHGYADGGEVGKDGKPVRKPNPLPPPERGGKPKRITAHGNMDRNRPRARPRGS